MIIIQVCDPHLDTATPRSRKDDYFEAIKEKLLEIRSLANTSEATGESTVGCFVGDLIHRQQGHLVPYRLTNWLIDYFQGWLRKPFLILGNHDILSRPDHWERQPIGAVIKAGSVRVLNHVVNPVGLVEDSAEKLKVAFTGVPYYYGIDQDRKGYDIPRVESVDFHVHLVHGVLLPEGMTYFGDYTSVDQIKGFGGDLMLCGHMHEDLGVFEGRAALNPFKVVNFGAVARGSVSGFNLNRVVQVGWIRVYREEGVVRCSIQPKPLACAKVAESVFYVEELRRKKTQQADMAKLAESFSNQTATGFELIAPKILLESYLTQKRVSSAAEKLVRYYVDQAEQEL